jgi:hypothetical protein
MIKNTEYRSELQLDDLVWHFSMWMVWLGKTKNILDKYKRSPGGDYDPPPPQPNMNVLPVTRLGLLFC